MDSTHNSRLDQITVSSARRVQKDLDATLNSKRFAISDELMGLLQFLIQEIPEESEVHAPLHRIAMSSQRHAFQPYFDPITRVQTRRIRNRLKRYYQTTGIDDPIRIELSPKALIPLIRWRGPEQTRSPYSIGIRQFRCLSSDPADRIFCECLKQELLNALSYKTTLHIAAISQVDQQTTVREICHNLKLDAVVDAKVRKAAERLRVSFHLLSALDGSVVCADMYDCPREDLTTVRGQLVHVMAGRLHAESLLAAQRRPQARTRLD